MVHKVEMESANPVVSRLRSITAQVIACMSPNLLLLDLGMAISFAIIAMPDLLNASEGLSLNDEQASWFGSICFLAQPFGAVFSGPLVDFFGRKKANFLANVPHLIAWILMYYAYNLPILFTASALLGLGTGVMEAPINAYVGEITEASTRGALCTLTQLFTSVGVLLMYFLGTVVHWRTAALICLSAPIASMICVLFVPETPVWLLSRGREKDAIRSLRYLRGWTNTENIRDEFEKLVMYTKNLERCVICSSTQADDLNCEHFKMNPIKRKIIKFRYVMLCKETLRPLVLTIMYFSFFILSGYAPLRPNLVNVCGALGLPGSRNNIMMIAGVLTFAAALSTIAIVKIAGKRKLAITAMLGCAISTTGLAIYARSYLDPSVSSYDTSTFPTEVSHIPEVLFFMLVIFTGLGIPWVLLGEVFPFRSRSTSQGLAAAANYVINFLAAKTFINFESGLGLWGALAVYAVFGYLGVLYLYFFLPETEGKTLIEIESYYNGKMRIFADDPFINLFRKSKKIIKFRYVMLCKETLRPLVLTIMYFSFFILSGYAPLRPNLVNVCGALGLPGSRNNIMMIAGVLTFAAALSTIAIVKIAGKRKLAITAMLGCAISTTGLAIYARSYLDPSVSSYDTSTFPTEVSHIPEVLFFMLVIFTGLGIAWVLLGEVFPFR